MYKKTGYNPATQTKSLMDGKLVDLSCPFTWKMENVIENSHKLSETKDDRLEMVIDVQEIFPEFVLIYHLMLSYESAARNDVESAIKGVDKAAEIFAEIKQKATLKNVENVLQHIVDATKCYLLQKSGQLTQMRELLTKIHDVKNMNKAELAMLNGCQSLAWSLYYVTDNLKAINYALRAVELDPGNGKWQYLLGKNYRRFRRMHDSGSQQPIENEISAYEKAYRLSKNALFGASLAQSYRESQNYSMATKVYKEIYALQPTSCTVRLQLALGFIRAKECNLANSCLKYVKEKMPDSLMYSHYMGIYHEECGKNSKAALPFYKSTTEKLNFGAEWQYMNCKKKVEPNWDPLPYMLNLLKKYENSSDYTVQGINIQIGLYYLLKMNDIPSACQYLTKAIKIQPDAKQLKVHIPLFSKSARVNVYDCLKQKVESALEEGGRRRYNNEIVAMLEDTLELCHANFRG